MPFLSGGQVANLLPQRNYAGSILIPGFNSGRPADYAAIWRESSAVRTVVDFLARNISQIGLHPFERNDSGRERLRDVPLADWCERPSPNHSMVGLGGYLDRVVRDLAIFDRHLSVIFQDRGRVWTIPVPVSKWEPVDEDWTGTTKFKIGKKIVSADQCLVVSGYRPDDLSAGGSPPLESLRAMLDADQQAEIYRSKFWRGGARPSAVIQRPTDAGRWAPEARDRFAQQWRAQFEGDGTRVGGTAILEDGMTLQAFTTTSRDAEYLGARSLTMTQVAAAFHIPPPLVGILDHATFSNITEQHKQLYQDTLGPWLRTLETAIQWQVIRPWLANPRLYVDFNEAERLRGTPEEQMSVLVQATGSPVLTPNEARARLNLTHVDGGDDLIRPLNVGVAGSGDPAMEEAPKAAGPVRVKALKPGHVLSAERSLKSTFERQRKAVLQRVGQKAAGDVFDLERWDRELGDDLAAVSDSAAVDVIDELAKSGMTVPVVTNYLAKRAGGIASGVNVKTLELLAEALDADDVETAVADVFEVRSSLAGGIASTLIAGAVGFAATEFGKVNGLRSKTWIAGTNPRTEHAALDGETIPLDESFSNGQRWPGDTAGGSVDDSGCNCSLEIA